MDRRSFIAGSAGAGLLAAIGAAAGGPVAEAAPQASNSAHVLGATAITKVYGDGQKLIAVALEYDTAINGSSLKTSTYQVAKRTITAVYTSDRPSLDRYGGGRFVIVEMSATDTAAALWVTQQGGGGGSGGGAPSGPGPGGPTVGDNTPGGTIVAAKATITQTGTVVTARGRSYGADATAVTTSKVINLIVDEFKQFTFHDPATGRTLNYNLFTPRGYDHRRQYPLVLFMHDASVVNVATIGPLVQGLGAVCWASPEDQRRHECFVLAPEYPEVVIDDNYKPSTYFDATVNLVRHLSSEHSIDRSRLYTTGQSMGAMLSLGADIKYPDLFAASFIVAGQWPAAQAAPLAHEKLWVLVSQDDDKAFPMENAIMTVIEQDGTKVATATWNGQSTPAQFAADVRTMEAQHAPVNYATFAPGTVEPPGTSSANGAGHMDTWHIAYTIPGIRDWVMRQHG